MSLPVCAFELAVSFGSTLEQLPLHYGAQTTNKANENLREKYTSKVSVNK